MDTNIITSALTKQSAIARRSDIQRKLKDAQVKVRRALTLLEQADATLAWATRENALRFSIDINLDDESELEAFLAKVGTTKGRDLADLLGLKGEGSIAAAAVLYSYAWNKHIARQCRLAGDLTTAIRHETTCDDIYSSVIRPFIRCW